LEKDNFDETSDEIIDETKDNLNNNEPKMKFCTNCGKPKPENSRFCPECGRDRYGRAAGEPQFIPNSPPPPQPYRMPYPQQRAAALPKKKGIAPALASLIVSLVNFFVMGSVLTFISLPVVIVLSVIVFKKGYDGKPMAIVAIVISLISALIFAMYIAIAVKLAPDIRYFVNNDREIVENYDKYGEIPEQYHKYADSKYDKLWKRMGYNDFDEFFEFIVDTYRDTVLREDKSDKVSTDDEKEHSSTSPSTSTEPTTDYDHSGEDLVVLS